MAEINEVVNVVENLIKFIDLMNDLGICYSDILNMSELCPDIMPKIEVIENWRKGNTVNPTSVPQNNEEDNTSTVTVPETEIITPPPTTAATAAKRNNNYFKPERLLEICSLIADNYNGKYALDTEREISSIYPEYERRRFHRLINKKTHAAVSDKYFIIKNGYIHKIRSK